MQTMPRGRTGRKAAPGGPTRLERPRPNCLAETALFLFSLRVFRCRLGCGFFYWLRGGLCRLGRGFGGLGFFRRFCGWLGRRRCELSNWRDNGGFSLL